MRLITFYRVCSIFLIVAILLQCNIAKNDGIESCDIHLSKDSKLFMHIDSAFMDDGRCVYSIKSGYFDTGEYTSLLYIDNDNVYATMSPKSEVFSLLFSFNDKESKEYRVVIMHRNWENSKGFDLIEKEYSVFVESIYEVDNERIALIKIPEVVLKVPEKVKLDAYVFFSEGNGFIGSYFKAPEDSDMIVGSRGNILSDYIDYSEYEFYTIE